MWEELEREPIFVLTGDQDWAPSWAMQLQWDIARDAGAPLHLFATSPDPLVAAPPPGLSVGIHPNFLPGSTHGGDPASVVDHCLRLVPGATTARTHGYGESTAWLAALGRAGIRADSNGGTLLQGGLVPLVHLSGLIRLPVFLEDDVLLHWRGAPPTLAELEPRLRTPGLKILDFHPSLVALNARTPDDYARGRERLFGGGEPPAPSRGRGTADLLRELLDHIERRGHRLLALPDMVARAEALAAAAWPDGLVGWRPGLAW